MVHCNSLYVSNKKKMTEIHDMPDIMVIYNNFLQCGDICLSIVNVRSILVLTRIVRQNNTDRHIATIIEILHIGDNFCW